MVFKAEESEINDPNAVAVATSNKENQPNVRMVLLKGLVIKVSFIRILTVKKEMSLKKIKKHQCVSIGKAKTTSKSYWKSRRSFSQRGR